MVSAKKPSSPRMGAVRDEALRGACQAETGSHMSERLNSPN